jgi:hypothetical protein
MYLFIDKEYRIYQSPILSGYARAQAKQGKLSVVNLNNMTGMNIDGSWSDIQAMTENFTIEGNLA